MSGRRRMRAKDREQESPASKPSKAVPVKVTPEVTEAPKPKRTRKRRTTKPAAAE